MNNKKNNIIMIIVIILIIGAVFLIDYLRNNGVEDKEIMCIAQNSVLYVSKTCGHCAAQKQIFGEHIDYLDITDCSTEPQKCSEIRFVPTWIINDKKYVGLKTLKELKELTGC